MMTKQVKLCFKQIFVKLTLESFIQVAISFFFFFQRYTGTICAGGGIGRLTAIMENNGPLEKMEELKSCSAENTV